MTARPPSGFSRCHGLPACRCSPSVHHGHHLFAHSSHVPPARPARRRVIGGTALVATIGKAPAVTFLEKRSTRSWDATGEAGGVLTVGWNGARNASCSWSSLSSPLAFLAARAARLRCSQLLTRPPCAPLLPAGERCKRTQFRERRRRREVAHSKLGGPKIQQAPTPPVYTIQKQPHRRPIQIPFSRTHLSSSDTCPLIIT